MALIVVPLLTAAFGVRAQEPSAASPQEGAEALAAPPTGGAALAAPRADVAARPDAAIDVEDGAHRLFLRSDARHDSARVERLHPPAGASHEWRCQMPCALTLAPGEYQLSMTSLGLDEVLRLESADVFVEGRPASKVELWLGVGLGVAGLAFLTYSLLAGEGACFSLGASCPAARGPLALGAGGFALALGVGLMFDSSGFLDVTSVRL